ncbi:2648_t:CDS:2 [Funneliformis geosporum]|uniref:2648_t:CDS:1 n=1 Tax=Funneliformis geosporum TaxID=1117311 RepID=A0A9W4SPM1_9GLOM|nr:2648_t:CDS:2 [Funneliformis geosporum]
MAKVLNYNKEEDIEILEIDDNSQSNVELLKEKQNNTFVFQQHEPLHKSPKKTTSPNSQNISESLLNNETPENLSDSSSQDSIKNESSHKQSMQQQIHNNGITNNDRGKMELSNLQPAGNSSRQTNEKTNETLNGTMLATHQICEQEGQVKMMKLAGLTVLMHKKKGEIIYRLADNMSVNSLSDTQREALLKEIKTLHDSNAIVTQSMSQSTQDQEITMTSSTNAASTNVSRSPPSTSLVDRSSIIENDICPQTSISSMRSRTSLVPASQSIRPSSVLQEPCSTVAQSHTRTKITTVPISTSSTSITATKSINYSTPLNSQATTKQLYIPLAARPPLVHEMHSSDKSLDRSISLNLTSQTLYHSSSLFTPEDTFYPDGSSRSTRRYTKTGRYAKKRSMDETDSQFSQDYSTQYRHIPTSTIPMSTQMNIQTNTNSSQPSQLIQPTYYTSTTPTTRPIVQYYSATPQSRPSISRGVKRPFQSTGTQRTTEEINHHLDIMQRFESATKTDQIAVLQPDYKTPFRSFQDAVARLLPYHVFEYPDEDMKGNDQISDLDATKNALRFYKRRKIIFDKYTDLLKKEAEQLCPTTYTNLCEKLIVEDEKTENMVLKEECRRLSEQIKSRSQLLMLQQQPRRSKTKKRSIPGSNFSCDFSTDIYSYSDRNISVSQMAQQFMGWSNSLDDDKTGFDQAFSGFGVGMGGLGQRLSVSLPKYIEGAVEVGKIINHTVIAVLTGNIAFLVEDIITYAGAARHCKAECKRLGEQFKIARDSAKELLDKLAENPKEIEDKSFASALKAFAIVLEDGRAVVKQHAEAKYGLKIFYAKKFAAEFQDIEERLDQSCNRLNFAINIRHFVDSQELEETHRNWHEEDKIAFAQLNNMVKESLEEIRGYKQPKNAPSQLVLLGTRINSTELSKLEQFKTDRLFTATYHTVDELRQPKDIKVFIKVTMAKESVPEEVSQFALEVAYLQKLAPSPNIIDLIGVTPLRGNLALVLGYCEHGDLQSFIASGHLKGDWGKKRSIALGIVQGIAFLHRAGILHKYINSANVLLDGYFRAKITNFRKSRWTNVGSLGVIDSFEEQIRWTAPERLGDDVATFTEECDIFSFGIVFYEIVSDRFPWQELRLDGVYHARKFEGKELHLSPNIPTSISSIFTNCTRIVPKRRFKTTDIIDHLEAIRPEDLENVSLNIHDDGLPIRNSLNYNGNKHIGVDEHLTISDFSEEDDVREEILERAKNFHKYNHFIEARREFEKINDHPHALFRLGDYYFFGKGVQEDIPKSIKYYEKAIEGGDGDAMDMLGYLCLTGKGISKDKVKAVEYFQKAVDKGIPTGMYHLGFCYFKGLGGLKKDVEESKRLMTKAAKMGNDDALRFIQQKFESV